MAGQGRQIGGLALCMLGVLGVCLACGLPMWRETSFVGANIVTAQSVSSFHSLGCLFVCVCEREVKVCIVTLVVINYLKCSDQPKHWP